MAGGAFGDTGLGPLVSLWLVSTEPLVVVDGRLGRHPCHGRVGVGNPKRSGLRHVDVCGASG